VVIVGATGNVGIATTRAIAADERVDAVIGVARRTPSLSIDNVTWAPVDITSDPLDVVEGADVVVHLAWKIQPQHDEAVMSATNVGGTRRLLAAIEQHRIPAVVVASSVGAYAPGPKRDPRPDWAGVSETWPATGIRSSAYSRDKAAVEAMLDAFEATHPATRVVRLRTSLVFQRAAASEIHRLFLGRWLPWHLPRVVRVIPAPRRLIFQATHADDIADAYRRAALDPSARGAYNVAADPVLTPQIIAGAVGGHAVPMPAIVLRAAAEASFRCRLQPSGGGWVDMALQTPLMDSSRVKSELGWSATRTSLDALGELLDGIGDGVGEATPPLHSRRTVARLRSTARRSGRADAGTPAT